ncbi:hypothetical protein ACSBR2_011536 [Camellia fascicularis]
MESHRNKTISSDKFSFPSTRIEEESEFEFGSLTITTRTPSSSADHLFFNGRLLPHSFPISNPTQPTNTPYSRSSSTSRSSMSSSRSNSSSSSARTSISEPSSSSSDQRKPLNRASKVVAVKMPVVAREMVRQYGSAKRWQFIAAAPELSHQVSRRRKAEVEVEEGLRGKKEGGEKAVGCGWRFFRSVASACKECHAIKPSSRDLEVQ